MHFAQNILRPVKHTSQSLFFAACKRSTRVSYFAYNFNLWYVTHVYGPNKPGSLVFAGKNDQGNLYLGRQPVKNSGKDQDDSATIQKSVPTEKPLALVVGVVEEFELSEIKLWHGRQQVKGDDWQKLQINFKRVDAEDFKSKMKVSDIDEALVAIHNQIKDGKSVYVHCKAGHGRSLTLVILYLMLYQDMTLDEAMYKVKIARPGVGLSPERAQAIHNFIATKNPNRLHENPYLFSYFPPSYRIIWDKTPGTDLDKAERLLGDYVRYNLPRLHWRNHTNEVKRILNGKTYNNVRNLIAQVDRIEFRNTDGSVAKRLAFIKQQCGYVTASRTTCPPAPSYKTSFGFI